MSKREAGKHPAAAKLQGLVPQHKTNHPSLERQAGEGQIFIPAVSQQSIQSPPPIQTCWWALLQMPWLVLSSVLVASWGNKLCSNDSSKALCVFRDAGESAGDDSAPAAQEDRYIPRPVRILRVTS